MIVPVFAFGYDAVIRLSFGATSRRSISIVCAFIHGQDLSASLSAMSRSTMRPFGPERLDLSSSTSLKAKGLTTGSGLNGSSRVALGLLRRRIKSNFKEHLKLLSGIKRHIDALLTGIIRTGNIPLQFHSTGCTPMG